MNGRVMSGKPRPYIPEIGKSVVKKVLPDGGGAFIDLSLNESSHGASPLATAAACARAQALQRYPDPASTELRRAIGRAHDLDPDRVVCGNGSEELLDVIGRLYARPGDEVLFTQYGFMQFPIVAMRVGATSVVAPERELCADIDELLARVTPRTRIVFIANPNNPTGTYVPPGEMQRLHAGLPGDVVLVIDSAYAEYVIDDDAYSDGREIVDKADNVVLTRTFSKAYGLAALRVGWAYGSTPIAGAMNRMRGIGNVNAIAQDAAMAALDDQAFMQNVVAEVAAERGRVAQRVAALGLRVIPSAANFVLVCFPNETNHNSGAALAHLAAHGVIARAIDDYDLDDYLRLTIGLPNENDAALAALASFMV